MKAINIAWILLIIFVIICLFSVFLVTACDKRRKCNHPESYEQPLPQPSTNAHGSSFHQRILQNLFHTHRSGQPSCRSCHTGPENRTPRGSSRTNAYGQGLFQLPPRPTSTGTAAVPARPVAPRPEEALSVIAQIQSAHSNYRSPYQYTTRAGVPNPITVLPDEDSLSLDPEILYPHPDLAEPSTPLNPSTSRRTPITRPENRPAVQRAIRTMPHRSMITEALEFQAATRRRAPIRTRLGSNRNTGATPATNNRAFASELESLSVDIRRLEGRSLESGDDADVTETNLETEVAPLSINPRDEAAVVTMEWTEVVTTRNQYAANVDRPGDVEGVRDPPPPYEEAVAESGVHGYQHVGHGG